MQHEQESQIEEETIESDVMNAEGCLHQKPRDVSDTEDVMDAENSLHQKPRDVCAVEEVMNDEGSLHHKSNEVCITETLSPLIWGGLRTRQCLLQVGVRERVRAKGRHHDACYASLSFSALCEPTRHHKLLATIL